MISEQAKQSIDYIFEKSARKSLLRSADDRCEIEILPSRMTKEILEEDIFVLTISSFIFRVLTVFHVGRDTVTREYFHVDSANRAFEEVFSELCNLCSGAMNHELLRYFPHLGMSTPYRLSGHSLPYLMELNPGYLSRHAITINDSVRLQATICVCNYAPLDFVVDKAEVVEMSGELEMF